MIAYRGQRVRFQARFEGSPKTGYPSFEVKDPVGKLVAAGTGSRDNVDPNLYYADVVIPADAVVSDQWKIEWVNITLTEEKETYTQVFEVLDVMLAESDTKAQQSIGLVNRDFRVFIRFMEEPYDIKMHILDPETDEPAPGCPPSGYDINSLTKLIDLDTVVYVFKGNMGTPSTWTVLWEYYPDALTGPYYQYEMLHIIPTALLPKFTELRHLIDKFQKTFGTRRAYEDAELLEYLMKGLDLLNQHHPLTNYTVYTLPQALQTYWVMYSAWYALNAQYMLEGDGMFDFSGPSVSLSVDRTGYIESEIERLKTYLDDALTKTKIALMRRQNAGVVAGRGLRPIPQFRYVGTWRRPRIIGVNY